MVSNTQYKCDCESKCQCECCICYTSLNNYNSLTTNCKHLFCIECFKQYISEKDMQILSCPMCRQQIKEIYIYDKNKLYSLYTIFYPYYHDYYNDNRILIIIIQIYRELFCSQMRNMNNIMSLLNDFQDIIEIDNDIIYIYNIIVVLCNILLFLCICMICMIYVLCCHMMMITINICLTIVVLSFIIEVINNKLSYIKMNIDLFILWKNMNIPIKISLK